MSDIFSLHSRGAMMVRDAVSRDDAAIYGIMRDAFGGEAEADLVRLLCEAGDSVASLVAEQGGDVVGHTMLSRMEAPFRALALAPVSVVPSSQGSGVGSALVHEAIRRGRTEGWEAIFVLGDPGYYGRFGFDAAAANGFASPYSGPHFMMLALGDGLLAAAGVLRHAKAFEALG